VLHDGAERAGGRSGRSAEPPSRGATRDDQPRRAARKREQAFVIVRLPSSAGASPARAHARASTACDRATGVHVAPSRHSSRISTTARRLVTCRR